MSPPPEPSAEPPGPTPTATYRLQLRAGFGLRDAARLVPYLARLGVSHVYCSPYLRARRGSPHGYDITDHGALHPEVGDEAARRELVAALAAHGMGQILDFVPNHMGIGQADNRWWLDVLEYGEASPWAPFFDIDWQPVKRELRGKVLVPFLGDHYGRVLERGELRLGFDPETGGFAVSYFQHRFPVTPRTIARLLARARSRLPEELAPPAPARAMLDRILAALEGGPVPGAPARRRAEQRERTEAAKRDLARLAADEPAVRAWIESVVDSCRGEPGEPASWRPLDRLLEAQAYRLAFWRVAADEINYRRFFNINELAGLRVERPEVFERAHRLVFEWVERGELAGLRIDHVDGLLDPRDYCERLRRGAGERPLYVVVEKILAHHESLRSSWPVQGTTGYDFLNEVGGLWVDPAGEDALDRTWRRFAPEAPPFDEEIYACKKHVMNFLLGGELQVLANELDRISESHWSTRDFTLNSLREALKEVVACFPVYRSYVDGDGATTDDRRDIDWAIAQARRRSSDPEPTLFDWIHQVLTTDLVQRPAGGARGGPVDPGLRGFRREDVVRFAMRFQQYSGPVMAKALEDTSFYRYHRLVSLNEVGGDPRRFGTSVAAFHRANGERLRRWPHAMTTTATHDTKRGEDTRLRIHVLSELAADWDRHARRWATWNRRFKRLVDERPAPAGDDEYLLYQTLVATWPATIQERPAAEAAWLAPYRERLETYAIKAAREAKRRSSWRLPNEAYEGALLGFLRALLDPARAAAFLDDLAAFAARVAPVAAVHGLAQLALKIAAPGIPDVYQGGELWDLALADPDNRRPVDWTPRMEALGALEKADASGPDARRTALAALLDAWPDGRVKLWVGARLLAARRREPALWRDGDYLALPVEGAADRIVAFARRTGEEWLVVAVPRLVAPLLAGSTGLRIPSRAWGDTRVLLPDDACPRARWRDELTGAAIDLDRALEPARAFDPLPLAVLRSV